MFNKQKEINLSSNENYFLFLMIHTKPILVLPKRYAWCTEKEEQVLRLLIYPLH